VYEFEDQRETFVMPDLIRDLSWMTRTARLAHKPGLAPAGEALFFASPKKSTQKKGDPMVWVPPLRYGQPPVLGKSGVELELALGSDNRSP
jgi:hypothetical protein